MGKQRVLEQCLGAHTATSQGVQAITDQSRQQGVAAQMEEVTVGANGRGRYAQRGGPDVTDLAIELIEHHLGYRFQLAMSQLRVGRLILK